LLIAVMLCGCATRAAEPVVIRSATPVTTSSDTPSPASDTGEIDPNVVSYDGYRDPLMPMSRWMFRFNDWLARYALLPLGKGYAKIVPDVVDRHIENFFYNVASPIYAVNNLLQAKPRVSGRNLARFGINTTIGLLGFFDPAGSWFGIERAPSDFAATLAHYDAGYGVYLVLPFFGPSDTRNALGRGVDYFLHPVPYLLDRRESFALLGFGYFAEFAQDADGYEKVREGLDDPYIFLRNLHLQGVQRDAAYR
jgi:phospholipid-binding lipoprotein MlaA